MVMPTTLSNKRLTAAANTSHSQPSQFFGWGQASGANTMLNGGPTLLATRGVAESCSRKKENSCEKIMTNGKCKYIITDS
jgi:hypothetical protein